MSNLLKNCLRFALFILLQVFLLDKIPPINEFIVPILYFLFILWLPFNISKTQLLLLGFLFGFVLDIFTKSPGLHASACTLIAYIRPFIIHLLMPKETYETNYIEPSIISMGFLPYMIYVFTLTIMHHFYLILLEWISFGDFVFFIGKLIASTGISMLLILITEMLSPRNIKSRSRFN
ncbi:MAG: rod shape-determining protein MreD [Chitinophagaceae bacterium]|nr:rod shape-determining protein MreD [Chitinophagaceae bacterium]